MKRCLFISIIFSLFYVFNVSAEDVFTWQDCVNEAKNNHPDLESAFEQVNQAKYNKDISITAMLPQIDADLSAKRNHTSSKTAAGDTREQTGNTYAYGISAQQLLFDGFKTSSNISSSSKTLQAQEYNYAVISSNIRLDLRNAFTELLRAQKLIPLTEKIAQRRKQNYEFVKLRYDAGREHRGSLMTAEADLANAVFEVSQAKRNIILAQRQLSKELGFSELRSIVLADAFILSGDYKDKPVLIELAQTTPFLQELIAKKEAAVFDVNSEEADFMPKVYLTGSLGRTNDQWPPRNDQWSAGVSVSLPLFEGGSRIFEVSKAKAKLRQTEADKRSGLDSVVVTLERTWKELKDAIENVSVKKLFLQASTERAKITRAEYATGLNSFDNWIIIEDNLVNDEKAFLNAQASMLIAEAYWIQAIGGTLDYDNQQI